MSAAAQTCGGQIQTGWRNDPAASDREPCPERCHRERADRCGPGGDRNVDAVDVKRGVLTRSERADMDGDLAELVGDGRLVGLEVWSLRGALLYADKSHPAGDVRLPSVA
jgi:hypothetical protein